MNTVYYNSACPVCDAGICALRAQQADGEIEWVDVHQQPEVLVPLNLRLDDVRLRLHVQDEQGRMHVGAEAVAALSAQLPRWGWLAALLRVPGLRWLARHSYNVFAALLFRWNRRRGHW